MRLMNQNEVSLSLELEQFIEIEFEKLKESVSNSFQKLMLKSLENQAADESQ
jgi:hypothetical protein